MAKLTFDEYLDTTVALAEKIREVNTETKAILEQHTGGALGDVTDFTGRTMTEAQYDALLTSFGNFQTYWATPGFNGTNISAVLVEKPA